MQQPDPADVQIERVVESTDIKPEDYTGSGMLILAPWELMLIEVSGQEDAYGVYWPCPRCLVVGKLGHAIDLKGHGMRFTTDCDDDLPDGERDRLVIEEDHLALLKDAGDLQVTVNPSIGCRCCGFHCYLEENTYRVLSDWNGDDGRDPSACFTNRIQKLNEHRPDAYQRVAALVEGDGSA